MTEPLDPLALPLHGSHLIEASAGTGKTWTIAALYVRLVVGHGCAPRLPGEILVMTFTRAATRELSERIRRRLVEAAAHLRGERALPDDRFLAGLTAALADGAQRQQAAWRLAMAAQAMDDAAIHTIDAWCQRMLREHAFDSGCLFDEELQAQEDAMRAEAVRDYWRQEVYPLADDTLQAVLARWKDIDALQADVRALADKPLPPQAGRGTLADVAAQAVQRRAAALAALKAGWDQRADDMLAWLSPPWADRKHPARVAVPQQSHATGWIDRLRTWALDPAREDPDLSPPAWQRLSSRELTDRLTAAGAAVSVPACFADLERLREQLQALPEPATALRLHAAATVHERLQVLKARAGRFGFADMLDRLDRALDPVLQGSRADRLRERVLAQYPVALIDEFQDTSPVQLRIFDRLYRIEANDPAHTLLLIGDPKQAIYRFRGADIYSYLWARRATEGRHHVLDTNHRSTQALVRAVNALFAAAEARPGEGAFQFRQPGATSQLPFVPVQARGRAEQLVCALGAAAPLTLVHDETLRNKADSRALFAALCAERIVTLLNDPQAGFAADGQPFKRLRPADIAVLVRSGTEADAVRREMRRRGLASVYLSDKDTVFQTVEAADLLRLLQAAAAPRDVRLVRAALATGLLGFSLPQLVDLASDDEAFDRECERLQQLNLAWKGQGVLAMVRQALHAFGLPARWLAAQDPAADGERRLTNVLHLAELLQAASAQVEGEQALLRWLQQQLADGEAGLAGGDDRVLRLESDADLVQVVTVHKSKGLEYPLVFLPFATHVRDLANPGESAKDLVLLLPGSQAPGAARDVVLAPTPAQLAQEEREQQRESLRLLYVALTRARHALWVGLSDLQVGKAKASLWHRSAIGYLVSGPEAQPPEQRLTDVRALSAACSDIRVEGLPLAPEQAQPPATRLQPRDSAPALAAPPVYEGQFDRQWSISSYTALVRDAARSAVATGTVPARVLRDDEPDEATPAGPPRRPVPLPAPQPWHRFPRGALAGNFLHDQLEWLAGERFALDASEELQQRLLRRCERQGWGHRGDDVVTWLRRVCSTPLPVPGTSLAGLAGATAVVPEMEFWFPSDGLQAQRVDALCRQHLQAGRPRPHLPERTLKGLLMGFADLVFEHAGRYWVLDYKSNSLGLRDADYTPQAMDQAMLDHRYDVQATLYLLALHRLLKLRLAAAYDPARHLGGAVYLFLRGIHGPASGCCPLAAPLALIEAIDATLPAGRIGPGRGAA